MRRLLASSSSCCFYPRRNAYRDISVKEVRAWAMHHRLPTEKVVKDWVCFLDGEFPEHERTASGKFSVSDVLRAAQEMDHLVVHSRDHAYKQIMVYCPKLTPTILMLLMQCVRPRTPSPDVFAKRPCNYKKPLEDVL